MSPPGLGSSQDAKGLPSLPNSRTQYACALARFLLHRNDLQYSLETNRFGSVGNFSMFDLWVSCTKHSHLSRVGLVKRAYA